MTAVDAATTLPAVDGRLAELADSFVRWLETGERSDDLFAQDVFVDLSVPHWRIQVQGADAAYHLREDDHPWPGTLRVEGLDRTSRGFLIQFEERWEAEGQRWYCRELIHAVVADGLVQELLVSCTGDWDEARQRLHGEQVRLLRP